MEGSNNRVCLECGREIHGRSDKKFCNDLCRCTYANRKYREGNTEVRRIDRILKKNYRILRKIKGGGAICTTTRNLFVKGFNFDYYTSIDFAEHLTVHCYDIRYRIEKDSETVLFE